MTSVATTAPHPEQGQMVSVRSHNWMVTEVSASSLPPERLQTGIESPQHLITLYSVEDDGLGEELSVIWELEPGARIVKKVALPEPTVIDPPDNLDALLEAVRWGASSSADQRTIQSPFRSGIDIEDYQLDPVVRAIQMPRVNLLVADDVGLGNTIEAGMVALELIIRHRSRKTLIVCPVSLQVQWQEQMRDKFGLDFRIVNSSTMGLLRRSRGIHVNPWNHFPRLITSIDFLKREPMLQRASNSWFGITLSALAIPQASGKLKQLIDDHWTILEKVQSEQNIELLQQVTPQLRDLAEYAPAEIWQSVQAKKAEVPDADAEPTDLKTPEWEVFIDPESVEKGRDFQLRIAAPPKRYAKYFEKIVLAERLREVRSLAGFIRIESPSDYDNPAAFPANQRVRLSRTQPSWVPASEIRAEGLFFRFKEDMIQKWGKKAKDLDAVFMDAHQRWRIARKLEPPHEFYPGVRFVLFHSFAHALMRQLAVECGYTTASLRERIYSTNSQNPDVEMAGVLIYTAAPDSEGTLGGLVSLGKPETLERHLDQALDNMHLCASDPLCAEHHPYRDSNTLHAASCHACLFAPETSCERGNKYLDRAVLVSTVERSDIAFFE